MNSASNKFESENLTTIKPEHQKKINVIQEEIVAFCKDQTFLQAHKSFYGLDLSNQMDFNNCVSTLTLKTKIDLSSIENFFTSCCHISDKKLHTNRCQLMLGNLINSYHDYLVIKKGIYIEYINFDESVNPKAKGQF